MSAGAITSFFSDTIKHPHSRSKADSPGSNAAGTLPGDVTFANLADKKEAANPQVGQNDGITDGQHRDDKNEIAIENQFPKEGGGHSATHSRRQEFIQVDGTHERGLYTSTLTTPLPWTLISGIHTHILTATSPTKPPCTERRELEQHEKKSQAGWR